MINTYTIAIPHDDNLSHIDDLGRCQRHLNQHVISYIYRIYFDVPGSYGFNVTCTEKQLTMLMLSSGARIITDEK
jgi:hypothetical protein